MLPFMVERHTHPDFPRLKIQLRRRSRYYQACIYLDGRLVQKSLKTDKLTTALRLGEEWYRQQLRASVQEAKRHPLDRLASDPTVNELYISYRSILAASKREYADMKWGPIAPYWRALKVSDIDAGTFREFYAWRRSRRTRQGTTLKNHTLHKDVMLVRQILKFAVEEGHLPQLPSIPKVGRIEANPRPWFTREEWDHLVRVSTERAYDDKGTARVRQQRLDLDDFLTLMIESMMRVNEVRTLTVGQVQVVPEREDKPPYLRIDVKGKTGHRVAVAGGLAVWVFERRSAGLGPKDRLFAHGQHEAFKALLIAAGLREDASGHQRNLKSVRATAISLYF